MCNQTDRTSEETTSSLPGVKPIYARWWTMIIGISGVASAVIGFALILVFAVGVVNGTYSSKFAYTMAYLGMNLMYVSVALLFVYILVFLFSFTLDWIRREKWLK